MNTRNNRLINSYNQIKKLKKKFKKQKELLCDDDEITFDDDEYNKFFSKPSLVIRKWNTPKKNEYFKEKLKHDLLPLNKVDDDEYKSLLVEIFKLETLRERYIKQLSNLSSNHKRPSSLKICQKRKVENIKYEASLNSFAMVEEEPKGFKRSILK
jgi:hypothetical protein